MALQFTKMHGAGNDFVIIDRRAGMLPLPAEQVKRMADRHRGVGFDQLITIDLPRSPDAVAAYAIFNADGSPAGQCGNGARCVVAWLLRAGVGSDGGMVLDSPAGRIQAWQRAEGIAVDMGVPDFSPTTIGLTLPEADPYRLECEGKTISFGAVSMGNPHAVIEVADLAQADVGKLGRCLQQHAAFRDSCNVGVAQVLDAGTIALRVYERGAGETLACGSGACAAVAVLARRGRVGQQVQVQLPGGCLQLEWPGVGQSMRMTGPAEFVFEGAYQA